MGADVNASVSEAQARAGAGSATPPTLAVQPVRLRAVALPAEHGGWGMLGEPLLLGLLAAPSLPGLGVGLAAVFAFLARHPLKLALADRLQQRHTPRTVAALRFVALYAALATASLAVAAGAPLGWWLPLAAAAPLALAQLAQDVRNKGRQLVPELLGAVALGSVAAALLLAAGRSAAVAAAAWALMALKAVSAILYVRARLRRDRGLAYGRSAVFATHAIGVLAALGLAILGHAPWLAAAGFGLLLARAAHGLSRFGRRVRPQLVGLTELAYGLAFVLAVALGYRLEP
jgi:hypothetical protein